MLVPRINDKIIDEQIVETLNDEQRTELRLKISELEKNLNDFIEGDELTAQYNIRPEYSKNHIQKCLRILNKFLENVEKADSVKAVKRILNYAVFRLNILHVRTKFSMIETMEREDIAEILNLAAYYKGAIDKDHDITEKFRIW